MMYYSVTIYNSVLYYFVLIGMIYGVIYYMLSVAMFVDNICPSPRVLLDQVIHMITFYHMI